MKSENLTKKQTNLYTHIIRLTTCCEVRSINYDIWHKNEHENIIKA